MSWRTMLGSAADGFMTTVWGRQPLHVSGADGSTFSSIVSVEQIEEILSYDSTRPPYVRVFMDGHLVDPAEYTYSGSVARRATDGLLDQGRLREQFEAGCTVVLDSIQHWLSTVRECCFALEEELGGAARATAFISPPEQKALELHADSYEIFVLQLQGTKEWTLFPRLDPVPRAGAVLDEADFKDAPRETLVLREGDLLYLPWGTPHSVRSRGDTSVHVSIAMSFPTWADVLGDLLSPLLADEELNGPVHPTPGTEEQLDRSLAARIADIASALSALDSDRAAAELIARSTSPIRRTAPAGIVRQGERRSPASREQP